MGCLNSCFLKNEKGRQPREGGIACLFALSIYFSQFNNIDLTPLRLINVYEIGLFMKFIIFALKGP